MNTIIPTFLLIVIFAATVWGCGSEPQSDASSAQTSKQLTTAPAKSLGEVQIEPPPSVDQDESFTNIAAPSEPPSVLNDSGQVLDERSVVGDLTVQRLALSREIRNREPVDAALVFTAQDAKLFAFVEVSNAADTDRSIYVTFRHESGHTAGLVELQIPANSPRWRTWAFSRNVQLPGPWTLLIEDEGGAVLDAVDFELAEPSSGL